MSAYHKLHKLYKDHGYSDLEQDVAWHMEHGYVIATPLEIILFRPVCVNWTEDQIVNLDEISIQLTDSFDAWHIHAYTSADFSNVVSLFPYFLPWVTFVRRGKLKKYSSERFLKHEAAKNTSSTKARSPRASVK